MAQLWEAPVSSRTISRRLAELNWSRKKKTYGYRERDDAKRNEFIVELGDANAPHYVYVDEAGMDDRDDYGDILA